MNHNQSLKPRFSKDFRESCLVVAKQCYGAKGTWAHETYAFINHAYFGGRLPWAHIIWGLTDYGSCIAWASTERDKTRPPIITLHPALLEAQQKPCPWGIPNSHLGSSLVFDTILHECIHVHIDYNLGGTHGRTSHDCDRWVRQVNRLAPLLGFEGIEAGRTKLVRVKDDSLPRTVRGKVATRVVRQCTANVPFKAVCRFPVGLRSHLGQAAEHYGACCLPQGAPKLHSE